MTLKFTRNEMMLFREAIQKAVLHYTNEIAAEYDDCLCAIKAALEELCIKLIKDTVLAKDKYAVTLKPHQGFAIRAAFAGIERIDYTSGWLGEICDKIHAEYSSKLPTIDPDRLLLANPT